MSDCIACANERSGIKAIDKHTCGKLKKVDWSEFDDLMESFGNNLDEFPDRPVKDQIKSRLLGDEVMTDLQHRYIIALFTNELGWTANHAFKFTVKVIPTLKPRLSKRVARETDIQALYQHLKKKEASKLINILKSIKKRNDNARSHDNCQQDNSGN